MITNMRQYRITRAQAERFRQALNNVDEAYRFADSILRQAMRDQYESQLEELQEELAEYERLHGSGMLNIQIDSLERLPEALVFAREALGLTQKELGQALGVSQQQVQRDEQTRYVQAGFERMLRVARVLGVHFEGSATIIPAQGDAETPGASPVKDRQMRAEPKCRSIVVGQSDLPVADVEDTMRAE